MRVVPLITHEYETPGIGACKHGSVDCFPTALASQLPLAPTISLDSHQNISLHTGARANVVLLTYLLSFKNYLI